jgi:hypothetical protein
MYHAYVVLIALGLFGGQLFNGHFSLVGTIAGVSGLEPKTRLTSRRGLAPNNAMQTGKVKLSRLSLAQKPRQLAFAADRER